MSFGSKGTRSTLIGLLRNLTATQSWTLATALVAMLGGSLAIGTWVQSARDEKKIVDGNREIGKLNADNDKLNAGEDKLKSENAGLKRQLGEANRTLEAEKSMVISVAQHDQSTEIKDEFLEKYLTYEIAGGDEARKLFSDYVCILWRNSGERNVQVTKVSLQLSDGDIRQGVSSDVRRMLLRSGLSERTVPAKFEPLANAPKIGPPAGVPHGGKRARASDEEISTIKKSAKNIYLVKTIHFKDGTDYQIPQEIATAVYDSPSCPPRAAGSVD
jgi:hypothetical protein